MKKGINFYASFYEKQQIPSICEQITFFDKPLTRKTDTDNFVLHPNIVILKLVPSYLEISVNKEFNLKKSNTRSGYAINLKKDYNSIDDYLKTERSINFKKTNIRLVKRLEMCFKIKYKMFYGNISKNDSDFIMNKLSFMIKNRFNQRSGRSRVLLKWDYYVELAYKGVNEKKASLFVIYNEDLPIEISLNFHYDNFMMSLISSYDLDYSKFSLGNIEIYKQVSWCIDHNIEMFDMCYGDFEYKRRWANFVYDFETYYMSNKKSVSTELYFLWDNYKDKIKFYLASKGVDNMFYDFVAKLKGTKKKLLSIEYDEFDCKGYQYDETVIDFKKSPSLRKAIYDLAFKSQEHINSFKVHQCSDVSNSYIVKGNKSNIGLKVRSNEKKPIAYKLRVNK